MDEKKTARFKRRELLTGSVAGIARQLETKIRGMAGIPEEKYLRPPGAPKKAAIQTLRCPSGAQIIN